MSSSDHQRERKRAERRRKEIDTLYDACVSLVVDRLREVPAGDAAGSDSPFKTVWDLWKHDLQEEESIIHDVLEGMVERAVQGVVEDLPDEAGALMTTQTMHYIDLDEEEQAKAGFFADAVEAELMERVCSRASDEPLGETVQRMIDGEDLDRHERDMEGYLPGDDDSENESDDEADGEILAPPLDAGCSCTGADAGKAVEAIHAGTIVKQLLDESHHIINLRRCGICKRYWVTLFYETIDWSEGDDPQTRVYVPVSEDEAIRLFEHEGEISNADIREENARFIVADYPKGGASSVQWRQGVRPSFPHD